jgi:photosystem II stability/assembly factor-like uncharacterized protein
MQRATSGRFSLPLSLGVALVALALALVWVPPSAIAGAQEAAPAVALPDLSHLQWRTLGPGGIGGRIVDFAVAPDDVDTIYAGTAQSGVWKSVNGGMSWEPIFDQEGSLAIGGLDVAATNPNIVWAGTGESNGRNIVSASWGDGVYKSEDAGRSWRNMGLATSQHIGRVRIHPRDAATVYVPVIGSLVHHDATANAARGLWRTRDGGETWTKILSAGDRAGFFDLAFDPRDPSVMYATTWERERVDWRFLPVGDDGGVFRSDDGGDTWQRLGNGLPTTQFGKVGLSVCASAPDTIYTIFEGPEGGVFRSQDRGASWERRNSRRKGSNYYSQVRCDPNDPDRVYQLETAFNVSHDGGGTFANELADKPVHVDHHALWINPANSDHLVLGNDGGIYITRDRGLNWQFASMNITQFYEIGVGMQEPFYFVCGGTQDNNSHCGPSATRATDGIVNDDWFAISGGDGFYSLVDPGDPTIIYSESQNGGLVRVDSKTGERKRIKPVDPADLQALRGETDTDEEGVEGAADDGAIDELRWNWSAPLLISRWDPATLYFGSHVVLRSTSRGDNWEMISPDLTRAITYDDQMNDYGTIRIIVESPLQQGRMAVGTDDGLVQVTDDGGATWRATEPLSGVPEMALVRRLVMSAHDADTIYAASSANEFGDYTPYLMRSTDLGRSWESIRSNLPDGAPVRAFAEHPGNANLLFVGTERGVSVTLDGGAQWIDLNNNLPRVAVHDMVIHPRENDLVVGTHGRGIWILEQLAVLEGLAAADLAAPLRVFPPRPAMEFQRFNRGRTWRGTTYFTVPNPVDGVTIDFQVSAELAAGEAPLTLTIVDAAGDTVRRLPVPQSAPGLHRLVWDMRHDSTWVAPAGQGGGGFFGGGQGTVVGPWVLPGQYEVRLAAGDVVATATVTVRDDPEVDLAPDARRAWRDLQLSLSHLLGTARAATASVQTTSDSLAAVHAALEARALKAELPAETREQLDRVTAEAVALSTALSRISRAAGGAYSALRGSTSRPSEDQVLVAESAFVGLTQQLAELARLAEGEMPRLAETLGSLGLPLTVGPVVRMAAGAAPPPR